MGSIFDKVKTIKVTSEENNTIDTLVAGLGNIERELKLTRKGHEAATWGEEVVDMEDAQLEDVGLEESD